MNFFVIALEANDVVLRHVALKPVDPLTFCPLQHFLFFKVALAFKFLRTELKDKILVIFKGLEVVFILFDVRLDLLNVAIKPFQSLFFLLPFVDQLFFFPLLVPFDVVVRVDERHQVQVILLELFLTLLESLVAVLFLRLQEFNLLLNGLVG